MLLSFEPSTGLFWADQDVPPGRIGDAHFGNPQCDGDRPLASLRRNVPGLFRGGFGHDPQF
ncbi:hypothetical protein [Saccharopolyspora sp. ASAGF58]|uniref:hypothetical protein n=1 Tax=Saccharopolyspora sp. ASAGF58 TaxID=2719023 RepID=UPI00144632BF|nr:hypothetical protein [Saccharopolyspora sp. ASAGF58]